MDARRRQVGKRIEDAMRDAGISKSELARICNTSQTTVKRWIDGTNVPPWEQAETIADAVGVPAYWLFEPFIGDREDRRRLERQARELLDGVLRSGGEEPEQP